MSVLDKVDLTAVITVPDHIRAIASAIRYDLNYGPTWLLVPQGDVTRVTGDCVASLYGDLEDGLEPGDVIEQTYTGMASKAFRDYLGGLPIALYYEEDSGCVSESEPQGWLDSDMVEPDESDYWYEPEPYYELDSRDIARILFGSTIASEFR